MTGQLQPRPGETATSAKRFWPKQSKAAAEGAAVANYGGGSGGAPLDWEYAPPDPGLLDPVAVVDDNTNGDVTISWTGGNAPFIVAWGDGEPEDQQAPPAHHTYHVDGDYTITVFDSDRETATVAVTVTGSSPALRGEWHNITTHAAMDAYMEDHGLEEPEGWDSMTLAQKREWLDENVEP